MQALKAFIMVMILAMLFGCETEYTPDIKNENPDIVVEGFIEAGQDATPPYVLLTKSTPFFSSLDANTVNELFVHDAIVTINDGTNTIELQELCLNDLTPAQQELAKDLLGFGSADSIGINICIYLEVSFTPTLGEEGKTYDLKIETDNKEITATTTIPPMVPLDSLSFVDLPDPGNDSLVEVRCFINDPAEYTSFYRYFTKRNSDPSYAGLASVIDDVFFDGQAFEFPLTRGQARTDAIDINTYGYFWKGDTIQVKWATIDEAHYNFWSTLEYNTSADGPFSSFTKVSSNINGGIGIWGGYGASYHQIIIPE